MAFPTTPTAAANTLLSASTTVASTTHTFPSLSAPFSPAAGDLLIAICVQYQGGTAGAEFSAWGAGFTELADLSNGNTTDLAIGIATKIAVGTESGTFTVTSAHSFISAQFLMRIPAGTWHGTTLPVLTAMAVAAGAAADPASLSPSWGAADTLWIAVGGYGETTTTGSPPTLTASPTNYSGDLIAARGTDAVGAVTAGVGFYANHAASEDAGVWATTNPTHGNGAALTVAVRPSSSVSANVTGVAGAVTAAGGVGSLSADQNLTGVAAAVTAAGGVGAAAGGSAGVTLTNSFEGGTSGTTVSLSNSGGASGDAFDAATAGSGATLAYDSAQAAHGTLSMKVATTTAAAASAAWTTSLTAGSFGQVWFRAYIYLTATPTAVTRLVTVLSATQAAYVQIGTTGKVTMWDSTGTQMVNTAQLAPIGAWFRIEGWVIHSATAGQGSLSRFDSMDSVTATESITSGTTFNTLASGTTARFGQSASVASVGPYWLDDVGASTTGALGPVSSGTSQNVTGVAAAAAAAGGTGTPAGDQNVTGAGALATAAGGIGSPAGTAAANVTGAGAQVTVAAGLGTPSSPVNVTGVAAHVTAAGGAGSLSAGKNTTGAAAAVTLAGGAGAASSPASVTGNAAQVTAAGGVGGLIQAAFPSRLSCAGQYLVDANSYVMPVLRGFNCQVLASPYTNTTFAAIATELGVTATSPGLIRMAIFWDQFETSGPNTPDLSGSALSSTYVTALDTQITNATNNGLYVYLDLHLLAIHFPSWAGTAPYAVTTSPAHALVNVAGTGSGTIPNGQNIVTWLANRYGNPSSGNYNVGVIGFGVNEPAPPTSEFGTSVIQQNIVANQAILAQWVRNYAPDWIIGLTGCYGHSAPLHNVAGAGQTTQLSFDVSAAPLAGLTGGVPTGNFMWDAHDEEMGTTLTGSPDFDARLNDGRPASSAQDVKIGDATYNSYPPVVSGSAVSRSILTRMQAAWWAPVVAYCGPSYANCPILLGEHGWNPVVDSAGDPAVYLADKLPLWSSLAGVGCVARMEWDYATVQASDGWAARPGAAATGADANGWQTWTNLAMTPPGTASVSGVAAAAAAAGGAGSLSAGKNTTGVAAPVTVAGGAGSPAAGGAANVAGAAAAVTAAGGAGPPAAAAAAAGAPAAIGVAVTAGTPSAAAGIAGVQAPVAVAAGAGTAAASASIAGVAAHATVTGGTGTAFGGVSGAANVSGVPAQVTIAGGTGTPSSGQNATGAGAAVTAASPAGVASAAAATAGTAAAVPVASPAGVPSAAAAVTAAPAPVTVASPAGTLSAAAATAGTAAPVTVAGPAGVPHSGTAVTGAAAPVTAAGGQGAAASPAAVTGVAAHVTAASPGGTLAAAGAITGAGAPVLIAAPVGALSAAAAAAGLAALVTALGRAGTPFGALPFTVGALTASTVPGATLTVSTGPGDTGAYEGAYRGTYGAPGGILTAADTRTGGPG